MVEDMNRLKLQALVYDILPLEEGAGKRWSECGVGFEPRETTKQRGE